MKALKFLNLQISDLIAYLLLPALAVILPADWSRRFVVRLSRVRWLLSSEVMSHFRPASDIVDILEPVAWMDRWRLVTLLEVRDLALIMCGRGVAVYREIDAAGSIEQCRDRVLIGMHWGPSIAILGLLKSRGLNPLLVYRPVERSILKARPFFYFFLVASVRYIRNCCGHRAITIRGASDALRRELPEPGTSVVVLDAPPAPGRSTIAGIVLDRPVKFNAGFPEILESSGREYQFYAISLAEGNSGLRSLELSSPQRPESARQLLDDYCGQLTVHLASDSAQWRIWSVARQFFQS